MKAAASRSSTSLTRRAAPTPTAIASACAGSNRPGRARPSSSPGRTSRTPAAGHLQVGHQVGPFPDHRDLHPGSHLRANSGHELRTARGA